MVSRLKSVGVLTVAKSGSELALRGLGELCGLDKGLSTTEIERRRTDTSLVVRQRRHSDAE